MFTNSAISSNMVAHLLTTASNAIKIPNTIYNRITKIC